MATTKKTTPTKTAKTRKPADATAASRTKSVRRTRAPKVTRAAVAQRDADMASIEEQIAVAAYYRAEQRGFAAGGELDDWLAAERWIQF